MTGQSMRLADLLLTTKDGDWGSDEPAPEHSPFYVIRGADFPEARERRVDRVPLRYLPDKTVHRRTLVANDILLETAGGTPDRPTGRTLLVTQDLLDQFDSPVTCASFARFLRADPALVDPGYLFWYLQAIYAAGETFEYQVQHTGVARFQYTAFAQNKQIPLPCVSQQQGIAEVLGALDDKIAANTSLTEAADELSRVVFTSMLNNTTSRALSDVADFVNGKAFTKDASGTGRVVIRIAELNSGLGGSTVYNDIDVADQYLARPGDLLFAWSGSLTLHRWFRAEGIINQHIFKVLPKDGYPTWCVNGLLVRKLDEFKGIAADKATTMGHIQRRHLDEPVDVPVAWQIERNDRFMTSLWQRALAAEEESLGLMTMRDALLPQLMSGKIWVRDVAQRVGDVV